MVKELIPRPLPAKARLHLALEENANLRTRISALEAQLFALRKWRQEYVGKLTIAEAALTEKDKEIAALREALVQIDALDPEGHTAGFSVDALRGLIERMGAIARAALKEDR